MKKILLTLLLILTTSFVYAGYQAVSQILNNSSGVALTDYALTSGVVVYSEPIYIRNSAGFNTITIVEDKAGGGGDVDISVEYSDSKKVAGGSLIFYPMYTSDNAGTITIDGNVVTALGNCSRKITHTVRMGVWIRYKFDPDADSKITVTYSYLRS